MLMHSIQSQGDYGQSCQIVAYENILSLIDEQPYKSFCEENCKGYKDTGGKCFFDFNCSAKKAQEQPKVDLDSDAKLEADIELEVEKMVGTDCFQQHLAKSKFVIDVVLYTARYFYGLRNRALEEAARHVYESWMGDTMDDVRRDMVELGKVLSARKED